MVTLLLLFMISLLLLLLMLMFVVVVVVVIIVVSAVFVLLTIVDVLRALFRCLNEFLLMFMFKFFSISANPARLLRSGRVLPVRRLFATSSERQRSSSNADADICPLSASEQ